MMDFVFITSTVSQSKVLRARLRPMRMATLLIDLQQLRSVLEHGVGDLAAAQHARQFGHFLARDWLGRINRFNFSFAYFQQFGF